LLLGVDDLPSIAASESVVGAARRAPTDPERLATLARCSHRGPGEIRPDGLRWPDSPELLSHLAEQAAPRWTPATAAAKRQAALLTLEKSLPDGQFRDVQRLLAALAHAMRAADVSWDTLAMVMAAAQRWIGAAARETLATGLITRPGDALFFELEELKQVATGEWHAGDRESVQASITGRILAVRPRPANVGGSSPMVVCPGPCDGPLYCDSPAETLPPAGATWCRESMDPGCAPFWRVAGCLLATGADPWSPGMLVARGLGLPAVAGALAPAA
jgi:hypothetical protein